MFSNGVTDLARYVVAMDRSNIYYVVSRIEQKLFEDSNFEDSLLVGRRGVSYLFVTSRSMLW